MDNKNLFRNMRVSVNKLSDAALRGAMAHDKGIDLALEHDFLITAINKLEDSDKKDGETCNPFEMVGEFDEDDGNTFEMMASTCEAIRAVADAYGGNVVYKNCLRNALRDMVSALAALEAVK